MAKMAVAFSSAISTGIEGSTETPVVNWTPAEITTKQWLKADDSDTITLVGAKISQWDDKSGNDLHIVQGTDGDRPVVGAQIAGKDTVFFDAGDYMTYTSSTDIYSTTTLTCCAVIKRVNNSSGDALVSTWGSESSVDFNNAANGIFGFISGTNFESFRVAAKSVVTVPTAGSEFMFTTRFNGTNELGYLNGTANALAVASTGTFAFENMIYGGRYNGSESGQGDVTIAEIIWTDSSDADEIDLLQGYMAWEWGLEDDLDAGHTYKSARPIL